MRSQFRAQITIKGSLLSQPGLQKHQFHSEFECNVIQVLFLDQFCSKKLENLQIYFKYLWLQNVGNRFSYFFFDVAGLKSRRFSETDFPNLIKNVTRNNATWRPTMMKVVYLIQFVGTQNFESGRCFVDWEHPHLPPTPLNADLDRSQWVRHISLSHFLCHLTSIQFLGPQSMETKQCFVGWDSPTHLNASLDRSWQVLHIY